MEGMMSGIVKNQLQGQFKDKTKDVQFKSVYTWARVAGFVAALIILGMFWNQIADAAACAFLAMAGALVALGMEAICCFKCCTKTKACATKIDDILSYGPFFKGTVYLVIATAGFITYHFTMTEHTEGDPPVVTPKTDIGAIFDYILFSIPGVLYILAFVITDKCKLRDPKKKAGSKESDIEEKFSDVAMQTYSPHEYQKKNLFSKACKHCGEAGPEACATKQEERRREAEEAEARKSANAFEKVKSGLTTFGSRMSTGFKELGAKMKIGDGGGGGAAAGARGSVGSPGPRAASPGGAGAAAAAAEAGQSENPFGNKRASGKAVTVTKKVEANPFL